MMAKEMHSTSRRELGRGEFGITYLCTDKETDEMLACKSISKRKLRTAIDSEVVRQEASIMNNLPQHPNIVTLKATYEDEHAVHLIMELCEGGEVFNKIVARGHYNERVAAAVTRTIVEVVQSFGRSNNNYVPCSSGFSRWLSTL